MPPAQPRGVNPGDELAYAEVTSDFTITAASDAASTLLVAAPTLTFDGATRIRIEFFAALCDPGSGYSLFQLHEDGVNLGVIAQPNGVPQVINGLRLLTPAAGRHLYEITTWRSGTNGVVYCTNTGSPLTGRLPCFIRITRA